MIHLKIDYVAMTAALLFLSVSSGSAQTVGYADALQQLGKTCGGDVAKFCKTVNLAGGRMLQCLNEHGASVSAACKTSVAATKALLATRARARGAVTKLCAADIIRACPDVKPGDGNLLECYQKAKHLFTPQCRKTVADAGYEAKVDPNTPTTQVALGSGDLVNSLQGVEEAGPALTAANMRQLAVAGLKDPSRTARMNRPALVGGLENRSQLTIAIKFDLNSARIDPASFQAVGLMADALNHPYLQGSRFLVVGHTDGKGNREYNLKLSQQRADAIREALINPLGIAPSRIEAVGLGEEQLLKPGDPEAAENRRVQLINVGAVR
jgi:outer membrane protein OmpA-like peptidoglycan-associated protein